MAPSELAELRGFLNASRDGDGTTSLDSPFQRLHFFCEEILRNIQPEAFLVQVEVTSSHSVGGGLGEKADPTWLQPHFRQL